MIIADTSAWVEFLRATGSDVDRAMTAAVEDAQAVAVPDVVRLELLAGGGSEAAAQDLARLLARFAAAPTSSPGDHDVAAFLYRAARRDGQTVRSLVDCLVAAIAVRLDLPVLARDRDFAVLATVSSLQLA